MAAGLFQLLGPEDVIFLVKPGLQLHQHGNLFPVFRRRSQSRDDGGISADPVKGLDVSILQDQLLGPVLGIGDPRTDKRIDFIGGIRGLKELERRVREDMEIAFSMYPTSIEELLAVADAGLLMPPKSTWFEPKLRSGLFIHKLS